jgi:hypothetical protein
MPDNSLVILRHLTCELDKQTAIIYKMQQICILQIILSAEMQTEVITSLFDR